MTVFFAALRSLQRNSQLRPDARMSSIRSEIRQSSAVVSRHAPVTGWTLDLT